MYHEQCPAGRFKASQGNETICDQCERGAFQSETGKTSCALCPPGKFTGQLGTRTCLTCSAGRFAGLFNSTICLDCAEGTYRPSAVTRWGSDVMCVQASSAQAPQIIAPYVLLGHGTATFDVVHALLAPAALSSLLLDKHSVWIAVWEPSRPCLNRSPATPAPLVSSPTRQNRLPVVR